MMSIMHGRAGEVTHITIPILASVECEQYFRPYTIYFFFFCFLYWWGVIDEIWKMFLILHTCWCCEVAFIQVRNWIYIYEENERSATLLLYTYKWYNRLIFRSRFLLPARALLIFTYCFKIFALWSIDDGEFFAKCTMINGHWKMVGGLVCGACLKRIWTKKNVFSVVYSYIWSLFSTKP